MELEIMSKENVKPSSPTPQNLRRYKFSMLDQIFPPMPIPLVLYFSNSARIDGLDSFISQSTEQLKRSLSVILTRFYPLAGRASGEGEFIDCNDGGVPFTVARWRGRKLAELLRDPRPDLMLPCDLGWGTKPGPDSAVALIQVNWFDCSGVAIGAVFWHKVADAVTVLGILRSWASAARGSKEAVCPNYIAQDMFPQKEQIPMQLGSTADIIKTGKSVVRRYIFYTSAISTLKSKSSSDVARPTRVEVVSALIWKSFMAASLANGKSTSLLTQTLDLRRRAQPPFTPECFGNFLAVAPATVANDANAELGTLVGKMRDSIMKMDDDYINRMRGDGGLMGYYENLQLMWSDFSPDSDILPISSLCGLDLYGVDFGWGKPVWFSKCDLGNEPEIWNRVWLIDTKNGDGVEAWVILEEKYMSVFDEVEELRALASIDLHPLHI